MNGYELKIKKKKNKLMCNNILQNRNVIFDGLLIIITDYDGNKKS